MEIYCKTNCLLKQVTSLLEQFSPLSYLSVHSYPPVNCLADALTTDIGRHFLVLIAETGVS